jgi:DNA-binding NtrC family response regulator
MAKILIIDDSISAVETAEMILVEAGYQAVSCTDGRDAIRLLRGQSADTFDLILTDIYMPDEDGLEVIREARTICPHVPIVAMSGITGSMSMLGVASRLGACQTVTKPFSREDLLGAIEAALSGPSPSRRRNRGLRA